MKRILPLVIVLAAFLVVGYVERSGTHAPAAQTPADTGDSSVIAAFEQHSHGAHVQGDGTVVAILPDDTRGSRHQRFLVRVDSGPTVLIAHNLDLAPRLSPLQKGDRVSFSGEYVWNPKGGLVHWTHRDPAGRHETGWLKHNGATVQ